MEDKVVWKSFPFSLFWLGHPLRLVPDTSNLIPSEPPLYED